MIWIIGIVVWIICIPVAYWIVKQVHLANVCSSVVWSNGNRVLCLLVAILTSGVVVSISAVVFVVACLVMFIGNREFWSKEAKW